LEFRAVEGIETKPLVNKHWPCDTVLDQGQEGACVGFGWSAELAARPKVVEVDDEFARLLYHRAQQLDEWTGENYSGTSVLAGAKAVQEHTNASGLPLIGEYRWAMGAEEAIRTLAYHGPIVLGITWYDNMYEPDENNYIHVSGEVAGGHCILMNGVRLTLEDENLPATWDNIDKDHSRVRLHNSWGTDWGIDGEAFLTVADLVKLLDEQDGEACVPMRRKK
jgi:hypothetical protein